MPAKKILQLVEATQPITEAVTKFGGQPVWLEQPEWPLSRELEEPMKFIGQFEMDPEIFPNAQGKMAYLFMTEDDDYYVDGTWKPDGGENAIIIQPGCSTNIPTSALSIGPTLTDRSDTHDEEEGEVLEFSVNFIEGFDEEFVTEGERLALPKTEVEEKFGKIDEIKVGGTPVFLQGDEIPEKGWQLLVQLDSSSLPFYVNFGDMGVGYGFISPAGNEGKFLWQC